MVYIETKYRNKLDLSNSLQLKAIKVEVDAQTLVKKNWKQIHFSEWNSFVNKTCSCRYASNKKHYLSDVSDFYSLSFLLVALVLLFFFLFQLYQITSTARHNGIWAYPI